MRRVTLPLVLVALVGAGCGADKRVPQTCRATAAQVQRALRAAPAPVALQGGTRLSTCVARARGDADLQEVGLLYSAVADSLARRLARSDAAALRLGYLVGAAQRGARRTGGIHTELVRRLRQSAGLELPVQRRAAFRRGLAAGLRGG